MIALLLAAVVTCTTPQPGPINGQPWVCVGGGWLPPGQAPAPEPVPVPPAPAPTPTGQREPLVLAFQVGHTYKRPATGVVIHIAAIGASKSGIAVYAAECLNTVNAEQCWYPGAGRFILANASADGWEELP